MMDSSDQYALPAGTRLLQIGPFKTGTTSVQRAAAGRRAELLDNGVLYPGTDTNHKLAISALLGLRWGWRGDQTAPADAWEVLRSQIDDESNHSLSWISHERIATFDDQRARTLVEALGGSAHVVITLRPLAAMLASEWQQLIKSGRDPGGIDEWVHETIEGARQGEARFLHFDHGRLIERWAEILGSENVTVVVISRHHPEAVFEAFEQLLSLPDGLLGRPQGAEERRHSNRSLTLPEVAAVAEIARQSRLDGLLDYEEYHRWIVAGAVRRVMRHREIPSGELRPGLPHELADIVSEQATNAVERIGRSGVRVIGDLSSLTNAAHNDQAAVFPDQIPRDLAAELTLGVAEAAVAAVRQEQARREQIRAEQEARESASLAHQLAVFHSADLLREVVRRGRRRAGLTLRKLRGQRTQ